jgi:hypothetical protein
MPKQGGYCQRHNYAYKFKCPNCADEATEARLQEEKRKFPHSDVEAKYQNVVAYWIMKGTDQMPFAKAEFFSGVSHKGGLFVPKFSTSVDGVLNAICYLSREAAHTAMTELLALYAANGEQAPDLVIGY